MLDIDHCLPWSAWPRGDLWNLLPASPRVNQHLKRDRLPSASALAGARESIIAWWENAWLPDPALRARFERETAAALPVTTGASTDDVFAGVEWRRLRLRLDQQVQEWAGGTSGSRRSWRQWSETHVMRAALRSLPSGRSRMRKTSLMPVGSVENLIEGDSSRPKDTAHS
jgi:hypothetical protein